MIQLSFNWTACVCVCVRVSACVCEILKITTNNDADIHFCVMMLGLLPRGDISDKNIKNSFYKLFYILYNIHILNYAFQ